MIRTTAAGFLAGAALLFALHGPAAPGPGAGRPAPVEPAASSLAAEFRHRHGAAGVDCAACHRPGFAAAGPGDAVCALCHGDHAAVAARTAARFPNPHDSHMGPQACSDCHSEHRASRLSCNTCHVFDLTMP